MGCANVMPSPGVCAYMLLGPPAWNFTWTFGPLPFFAVETDR